jgi:hypothetical protein
LRRVRPSEPILAVALRSFAILSATERLAGGIGVLDWCAAPPRLENAGAVT